MLYRGPYTFQAAGLSPLRFWAHGLSALLRRTCGVLVATPLCGSAGAARIIACRMYCWTELCRAPAPVPEQYKELKGWKVAAPIDTVNRGAWWSVYKDKLLDKLASQVEISNQNVIAAAAAYEQARAIIREAQASLFPTLTGSYTATRSYYGPKSGANKRRATGTSTYTTIINPQAAGSWAPDVWGKVRRQIESNVAAAQVSAADLDNAKLSAQGMLAIAYFNLSATNSLRLLLDRTIVEYKQDLGSRAKPSRHWCGAALR